MTYAVSLIEKAASEDGKVVCNTPESAVVLGLMKRQNEFTPVEILKGKTDMEYVIEFIGEGNALFLLSLLDIVCRLNNGG